MITTCPYCRQPACLTMGATVYPHRPDLHAKHFYLCAPCGAWVGCHPGTTRPLGRLANAELRAAKVAAHAAFDPLWRGGQMTRSEAYGWLAEQLGIKRQDCHIWRPKTWSNVGGWWRFASPKKSGQSDHVDNVGYFLTKIFSYLMRAYEY